VATLDFRSRPHHLTLKEQKTKSYDYDKDIRHRGIAVLGSFIGPREGREKFLKDKIEILATDLDKLYAFRHGGGSMMRIAGGRELAEESLNHLSGKDTSMRHYHQAQLHIGVSRVVMEEFEGADSDRGGAGNRADRASAGGGGGAGAGTGGTGAGCSTDDCSNHGSHVREQLAMHSFPALSQGVIPPTGVG
jgi:hypothetical protein